MKSVCIGLVVLCVVSLPAFGWGGVGHKAVTYLALDAMHDSLGASSQSPAWLFTEAFRDRAAYQSIEADRYRAVRTDVMSHMNNPEHYLDIEMLADYGLTLDTLPPLRRGFVKKIVAAHMEFPERFAEYDAADDEAMVYFFPGFGPYAVMEEYTKLVASFRMVRMLNRISGDDAMRLAELGQARANAVNHMGMLSHWVGDLAQPLHTTVHHHGWVGENPEAYTTEYGFHGYIDSGVIEHHGLAYDKLRGMVSCQALAIDSDGVWESVLGHVARSFDQLEEAYRLERDGQMETDAGERFIVNRLADGSKTLAGLYIAAWHASAVDDEDIANYLKFEPTTQRMP